MAKRLTKDSPHYVNNKEFTAALDAYSRKCRAAIEADEPRPVMNRYLGDCIIRMSTRLSLKSNFVGYPYRDEMVQDAILAAVKYAYRFNGDRYNNGFAFVTQILFSHMVQRIKKEKKKYLLDLKLIQGAEQQLFLNSEFTEAATEKARTIADQKLQDLEESKAGKDKTGHSRGGFKLRSHTLRVEGEIEAIKAGLEEFEVEGKHYKVRDAKREEYWAAMRKHNNPPEDEETK